MNTITASAIKEENRMATWAWLLSICLSQVF